MRQTAILPQNPMPSHAQKFRGSNYQPHFYGEEALFRDPVRHEDRSPEFLRLGWERFSAELCGFFGLKFRGSFLGGDLKAGGMILK